MSQALWQKYTEDELKKIYGESKSLNDFLKNLGYTGKCPSALKTIREKYPWCISKKKTYSIGDRFGRLTLLEKNGEKWVCQCDCGKRIEAYQSNVTRGLTQSCGCLRKEKSSDHITALNNGRAAHSLEEEIGQKYGMLSVIAKDDELTGKFSRTYVKCICHCGCGQQISVRLDSLKSGSTTSCGTTKSRGELLLIQILNSMNVHYKTQVSFDDLFYQRRLYFDFAIYNQNEELILLIEYQGKQHYESSEYWGGEDALIARQERDQKKRDYCREKNIPLIEIKYTDFKDLSVAYLERRFSENGFVYEENR